MDKNIIAKFDKISFKQFEKDWIDTYGSDVNIIDIYNHIKEPKRATIGSAGYDIFAPIDIVLEPNQSLKIPTGIRCKISDNWFMGIFPRSGQGFKYGLRIANTVGIIDSDYCFSDNEGHIFIKLINDSSINKQINIYKGEAFAQAIFIPYGITVNDNVERIRKGGFGSTS